MPLSGHNTSQITALFKMGRGVVGSTTFAFSSTCFAGITISGALVFIHEPAYALLSLLVCFIAYFIYQYLTWKNVEKNPDAGMTGDYEYYQITQARMAAAKEESIVIEHQEPALAYGSSISREIEEEKIGK